MILRVPDNLLALNQAILPKIWGKLINKSKAFVCFSVIKDITIRKSFDISH
jgi:hypothetical protein